VGVGGLAVVRRHGGAVLVRRDGRIPAAVLRVPQAAAKRGQTGVDEWSTLGVPPRGGGLVAEDLGEGEDVEHPAGDPELDRPVEERGAFVVEPREAALRVRAPLGEIDQ
jgi:hypothetical protein